MPLKEYWLAEIRGTPCHEGPQGEALSLTKKKQEWGGGSLGRELHWSFPGKGPARQSKQFRTVWSEYSGEVVSDCLVSGPVVV